MIKISGDSKAEIRHRPHGNRRVPGSGCAASSRKVPSSRCFIKSFFELFSVENDFEQIGQYARAEPERSLSSVDVASMTELYASAWLCSNWYLE